MRSPAIGVRVLAPGSCAMLVALVAMSAPAAGQSVDPCLGEPGSDWCLESELPGDSDDGPHGGGRGGDREGCGWERVPEGDLPGTDMLADYSVNGLPPDDQAAVWYQWCDEWEIVGSFRWVPVAEAPTPAEVVEDLYEVIQGRMPALAVETQPSPGVDAVIQVPVFITITNWVDELVETRPLGGETVTVTATPELLFDTGEDGVAPFACRGPGRPYDANGGDLWEQAASAETCAHPYTLRTGAEGRPEEWPSTVTVRWSISWSATSGEVGAFPAVDRSIVLPRGVVEVRAVVVSGGG